MRRSIGVIASVASQEPVLVTPGTWRFHVRTVTRAE
jgi:hypothetical protein